MAGTYFATVIYYGLSLCCTLCKMQYEVWMSVSYLCAFTAFMHSLHIRGKTWVKSQIALHRNAALNTTARAMASRTNGTQTRRLALQLLLRQWSKDVSSGTLVHNYTEFCYIVGDSLNIVVV